MSDNYNGSTRGKFYSHSADTSEAVFQFPYIEGEIFSVCYRNVSCWLREKTVSEKGDIPEETIFVLAKREGGYKLYFALCDGVARCSLFGESGKVFVRAETGDGGTPLGTFRCVYVISGEDPYECVRTAYEELRRELGTFTLKKDKKTPYFADLFGYCTYNAYYDDIGHDVIVGAAEKFKDNGVTLGFLIVDAGWQTTDDMKMTSFSADVDKFPYGLKETANECKRKYGLKEFIVWHTYCGFWKGVDADSFEKYGVKREKFNIPQRFLKTAAADGDNFNATVGENFYPMNIAYEDTGLVSQDMAGEFYSDFYKSLKEQGADGVKVDAMTWIEAFAEGKGGRVKMMKTLLFAMQNAADENFGGEVINCSSCSNDFFLNIGNGSVTRTSGDYMPDKNTENEIHIKTNAFVSFWTDPVIVPDWDMFETGSKWGGYHAAARAVSGGPVYCTDDPQNADYSLIRKLSTADGRVKRCVAAAKPTEACLFGTPEGEPFRIFNRTENAYVLAAFSRGGNAAKDIPAREINGLPEGRYAAYSSLRGFLGVVTEKDTLPCKLCESEAEIFTLAPVKDGFAVVGMTDKLNPSAFTEEVTRDKNGVTVKCAESGKVGIYCDKGGFCEKYGKVVKVSVRGGNDDAPKGGAKLKKSVKNFFGPNNMMMYLMLLPTLAYIFIFGYLPLAGLVMAFKNFIPSLGIWDSPWADMGGFHHFHFFVTMPDFWNILKNTLVLSVYSIVVNTILPIILALFMNEIRNVHYKKTVQTISYAPYFVSVMVVCGMLFSFSGEEGIINRVMRFLSGDPELNIKAMESAALFPHLYVISGLWQGLGWWAIIYMGTLANVDANLHEAAIIDGAGRMKRIWHINVPTILPMATIMFIMSIGNMLSVGFEKVYLMQTAGNLSASQIISTYVYNISFRIDNQFSYATAIGLFNSVINIFLLWLANFISKRVSETSLW
ncbi:MAG: hypothetical protein IJU84_06100 [Clostridia bacterium]|nr:hypothetical protein [Clostridia bacterium]